MSMVPAAAVAPPAARRGPVISVAYVGFAGGVGAGAGPGIEVTPASVWTGAADEAGANDWRCRLRCFFFFLLATGD